MKQAPSERMSARGLRVALLRSAFRPVVEGLVDGARQALLAAQAAAGSGRFDAVVAWAIPGLPR